MASLFIEILPGFVSLIMGVLTTYWKQGQADLHEERLHSLKATENARKDQSRGTSYSRKFIVHSVIGSMFLFPMLLTILNWLTPFIHLLFFGDMPWVEYQPITIHIPVEMAQGGLLSLLWSEETTEYMPITGFVLMPIHWLITQIIVGYYFGASGMRRFG